MYQELDELVLSAKSGEKSSKEEIIRKLNPLIFASIKRYYNNGSEYEDLVQEGKVVILECIENHNDTKGAYFLGYAKTMLKYHYLNRHKIKTFLSLNEPIGENQEEELLDLLESGDMDILERLISSEESKLINRALSYLTERQREVVVYYYVKEISIGEIAKKLNITYRTVVNTKVKALEKLRGIMRE